MWEADLSGGRVAEPDDVAAVIGLLGEPGVRAVTGAMLRVDAGSACWSAARPPRPGTVGEIDEVAEGGPLESAPAG